MGKISNSTLNKVLLRTQGCQFAHNYERMQSLSLTYTALPLSSRSSTRTPPRRSALTP